MSEGSNEPALIVFMSKVVGGGICEALSHAAWEDRELNLRQRSSIVRLDNFLMNEACVCEDKTDVLGAERSSREETGR